MMRTWWFAAMGVAYLVGYVVAAPLIHWGSLIFYEGKPVSAGATPAMQALAHTLAQHKWPPFVGAAVVFVGSGGFVPEASAWKRFLCMAIAGSVAAAGSAFAIGYWNWHIG